MNYYEKEEIGGLPEKYRPLTAWAYVGYQLLFAIPFIGFIILLVFCFSDGNINRRSFARSYFCVFLLVLIVLGVLLTFFALSGIMSSIISNMR